MKDLIQIFDKFRVEKKNLHVCIMNQVSLRDREYCVQKQLRSNALKRNELKVYISLNSNKLACFWNSQGSFQVHDLVDDFWKKCPRGARFFAVVQTCTKHQKSQTRHTKKLYNKIFNSFSPLITFMWSSGFYWYEHVFILTEDRTFFLFIIY